VSRLGNLRAEDLMTNNGGCGGNDAGPRGALLNPEPSSVLTAEFGDQYNFWRVHEYQTPCAATIGNGDFSGARTGGRITNVPACAIA